LGYIGLEELKKSIFQTGFKVVDGIKIKYDKPLEKFIGLYDSN